MNRGWKTIFFKNKPQYKSIESWELFRGKKYLKIDNNKIVVKWLYHFSRGFYCKFSKLLATNTGAVAIPRPRSAPAGFPEGNRVYEEHDVMVRVMVMTIKSIIIMRLQIEVKWWQWWWQRQTGVENMIMTGENYYITKLISWSDKVEPVIDELEGYSNVLAKPDQRNCKQI